jgi:hypothetical protein
MSEGDHECLRPRRGKEMNMSNWKIRFGILLIAMSILAYFVHYVIFRNPYHIFIYMIGDIGFVFFEVLLVTFIILQLLNEREKRARLEKMNMVIGAFFSEVGTTLLTYFSDFDPQLDRIRQDMIVTDNWSDREFSNLSNKLKNYRYEVDIQKVDLDDLSKFLYERRDFLLRLLENPTLLEHESFSELLRTVFHMTEEFSHRKRVEHLPESDLEHLAGDLRRAYTLLVHQWLSYMKHLKDNYPYLFSLAIRTNPFDQEASPIVT